MNFGNVTENRVKRNVKLVCIQGVGNSLLREMKF